MKLVNCTGKLFAIALSDCSGGKSCCKSDATICQRRSRFKRPFSRCSPISRSVTPTGNSLCTSSAVGLESRTCPPYAGDMTRCTRVTASALFNRAGLRRTGMKAHPHFDRSRIPRFVLQAALRSQRRVKRIARRVERGAECIARDLKDMSVVARDGLMQDSVMPREEGRQFSRELLCQRGAALDVG